MPLKILATGFGAFPGSRKNPTAALMRALGRERGRLGRLGIELHCAVLPVHYAKAAFCLKQLEEALAPGAILHFGLAARRKFFGIETRALNRFSLLRRDAAGICAPCRAVLPGEPYVLRATFPAEEIAAALCRAGILSRLSINPGSYVCNEALYLSLARSHARVIGFIHVPRFKRQGRRKKARDWRPDASDLLRAALIAIVLSARKLRQRA